VKPEGKPTELTDLILDARDAAEERLTLIYRSIFTGKPMGKAGPRRSNEPAQESPVSQGPQASPPFPPQPGP